MTTYYSNTTKGFYKTDEFDYPSLPNDIIEITSEQHKLLVSEINGNNKIIVVTDGTISLQDKPVVVKPTTWEDIRIKRNSFLLESDFTQLADFNGDRVAWAAYRQQLRDIPSTFSTPEEVIFPAKPN
jgi:hypothetical protein